MSSVILSVVLMGGIPGCSDCTTSTVEAIKVQAEVDVINKLNVSRYQHPLLGKRPIFFPRWRTRLGTYSFRCKGGFCGKRSLFNRR